MGNLNYLLLVYIVTGILVAGGLFFNRKNKANIFLALFILLFSLDQLYFLYESSDVIRTYPNFYFSTFPFTLLFGPALYFHIMYLHKELNILSFRVLVHLVPFIIMLCFTIYALRIPGWDRVKFIGGPNYYSIIKPINYFKVIHLCFYALLMILYIKRYYRELTLKKKNYTIILISIYFVTAVLQACFTAAILLSKYFIVYYVVASTVVLFVGYILYFHQNILERINIKYSKSVLKKNDKKRISQKIDNYISNTNNIINQKLNLDILSQNIEEKKHHISQTLSEVYKSSFNDLINEKRIEYSKTLLMDSKYDHLKILAVALDSGFTNKTTFNRAFIKFNSCTPSQFKNRNR